MRIYAKIDEKTGRAERITLEQQTFTDQQFLGAIVSMVTASHADSAIILEVNGEVIGRMEQGDEPH